MYSVYVLKSVNKKFRYVGMTSDLERRLNEHNKGYSTTTKKYLPVELIYSEFAVDRKSARMREKFLKSGIGREFLDSLQ